MISFRNWLLFVKGILQKTNDTESEFEDIGKQHTQENIFVQSIYISEV